MRNDLRTIAVLTLAVLAAACATVEQEATGEEEATPQAQAQARQTAPGQP